MSAAKIAKMAKELKISSKKAKELLQQQKNSLSFSSNSNSYTLFAPLKSSGNDDS